MERGWHLAGIEAWLLDAKLAARALRRAPLFTVIAVASLALAIGANLAFFNLIEIVLLRPLPVAHASRLTLLTLANPANPDPWGDPLSYPMYRALLRRQRVFSAVIGYVGNGIENVNANGSLSLDNIWAVTGNFYAELGAQPFAGRLLTPADVNASGATRADVAVLGYRFWQRTYDGSLAAVGQTLRIEGKPFVIVGIAPDRFTGLDQVEQPDLTIPMQTHGEGAMWVRLMGVRRPGVSLEQARAQLEAIWPAVQRAAAPAEQTGAERQRYFALRLQVVSGAHGDYNWYLAGQYSRPLWMLLGLAGLGLLIACVNLASLMLAHAAARAHDLSIRAALGAGRWRLARGYLIEGTMLGGAGAALGLILAFWAGDVLLGAITQEFLGTVIVRAAPNAPVVAAAAALAVAAGVLFSLAAAWRLTRQEPARALEASARVLGRGAGKLAKPLIASQVALSLVLLMSAGLLARSFETLRTVPLGYRSAGIMAEQLASLPGGSKDLDRAAYEPELFRRIRSVPGVRGVAYTRAAPGSGATIREAVRPAFGGGAAALAGVAMVDPGFFALLRVPLVSGHDFAWSDGAGTPPLAILSRSLAARLFPHAAVGASVIVHLPDPDREIAARVVGVAANTRLFEPADADTDLIYLPLLQMPEGWQEWGELLVAAGARPQAATLAGVRQAVAGLGHEYVFRVRRLAQVEGRTLRGEQLAAACGAFFGMLALALAAIGLYGLMAFLAGGRRREIGIRMALGAPRGEVLRSLLAEALVLAGAGLAVGVPAALAAARLLRSLLYGISPADPATLAGVGVLLALICLLAAYFPARRAARLDPTVALRQE